MNRCLQTLSYVIMAATLASTARGDVSHERSEKVVPSAGLKSVAIENARGLITVRRGEEGRIHLVALKVVRGGGGEHARRFARETQVVTSSEGQRFVVRVKYPQRQAIRLDFWEMFSGFEMPRVEVRLEIEMPAGLSLSATSTSGDLVTEGVAGEQRLETTSGDISARDARDPIRCETTSGDISITDVGSARLTCVSGDLAITGAAGAVFARTTSGQIVVKGARDSLELGTVSGDVEVDQAPHGIAARSTSGDVSVRAAAGSVTLESSSGDVSATFSSAPRSVDVSTVSGNIVTSFPAAAGYALEMRTTSGSLDLDVALQVKTVTRHVVAGVVKNGTAPVRLRSSSGDIHVTTGENP